MTDQPEEPEPEANLSGLFSKRGAISVPKDFLIAGVTEGREV